MHASIVGNTSIPLCHDTFSFFNLSPFGIWKTVLAYLLDTSVHEYEYTVLYFELYMVYKGRLTRIGILGHGTLGAFLR